METIEEIKKLKSLLDSGAISEAEFQRLKADLLVTGNQIQKHSISKKRNWLKVLIISLFVTSGIFLFVYYLNKTDKINLPLRQWVTKKDNINSNDIDSLNMFNNIIYDNGIVVGEIVKIEFTISNSREGHVFKVPNEKMWTPLFFEFEELGNNYYRVEPEILTEQFTPGAFTGRRYYEENIYHDFASNIGWVKQSGYDFPKKEDFESIKYSIRNRKALSGRNAIYLSFASSKIKFSCYFFEENIR